MQYIITKIELQFVNKPDKRRIKVHLKDIQFHQNSYVYITPCYEGYEVWHANMNEAQAVQSTAKKFNAWLHNH